MSMYRDLAGSASPSCGDDRSLALLALARASLLAQRSGRWGEAEVGARGAVGQLRELGDGAQENLVTAVDVLGSILADQGRLNDADEAFGSAPERDRAGPLMEETPWALLELHRGQCLARLGRIDRAEEAMREAAEILTRARGPEHSATLEASGALAHLRAPRTDLRTDQ
jgi:tetratricopeptide (TPR) repeat protein